MKKLLLILTSCLFAAFCGNDEMFAQNLGRGFVVRNEVTANEIATIGEWGGNLIKWEMFWRSDGVAGQLDHLVSTIIPACNRHGVGVIVEMHEPPGGKSNGKHTCVVNRNHSSYNQFTDTWRTISNLVKHEPAVIGYDLLAEPYATIEQWRPRALEVIQAIRANNDGTKIIVEMPYGNPNRFKNFRPYKPRHAGTCAYGFHWYSPHSYTHGARGNYPNNMQLNKQWMRSQLRHVKNFRERYGREVFVAGFSARFDASGSDTYVNDAISIFEEPRFRLSWAYHNFTFDNRDWWHIGSNRELILRLWFLLN